MDGVRFGDKLAVFVQISSKIVNFVFSSKMLNFAISFVFCPKRISCVPSDYVWNYEQHPFCEYSDLTVSGYLLEIVGGVPVNSVKFVKQPLLWLYLCAGFRKTQIFFKKSPSPK